MMINLISMYSGMCLFLFFCFTLVSCQEDQYRIIGKEAVIQNAKFKYEHQRLPNDLEEVGIRLKKRDRYLYYKMSNEKYRLSYQVWRSRFVSYISEQKKWDNEFWLSKANAESKKKF